jgi:hypothetical protein
MSTSHIDFHYAYFNFSYTWLRDKQLIHRGNELGGVLIITDMDGKFIKVYQYERIV